MKVLLSFLLSFLLSSPLVSAADKETYLLVSGKSVYAEVLEINGFRIKMRVHVGGGTLERSFSLEEFKPHSAYRILRSVANAEDPGAHPRLAEFAASKDLIASAQIGDGAAVTCDQTGDLIALTTPDSGEYINQTTFLITPGALDTAQVHIWHGSPSHIAIFSDGLQMLALTMPFGKPHRPFFSPLFHFISNTKDNSKAKKQLASFLRSPRVRERTDDDLTLMLAALTD